MVRLAKNNQELHVKEFKEYCTKQNELFDEGRRLGNKRRNGECLSLSEMEYKYNMRARRQKERCFVLKEWTLCSMMKAQRMKESKKHCMRVKDQ